jgi:hypothetical protein
MKFMNLDRKDLLKQALVATNDANDEFLAKLTSESISTITTVVPTSAPSMYVLQGECALIENYSGKGFHFIGSDDATTCVIICLQSEHFVYISHVDEDSSMESLKFAIVQRAELNLQIFI